MLKYDKNVSAELISQIDQFHQECSNMAKHANIKAEIYRITSIILSMLILLFSISIAIISRFDSAIITNIITVLSGLTVGIQMFISVFNPAEKAGLIKKIAQTLRRL